MHDDVVKRTLPFMAPTIADMVKIQRGVCMRPKEVCNLRVGDLDKTGRLWATSTKKHKTARFGVIRFTAFGAAETEILRRRCAGKGADEYVFSPREAALERWEAQAAARKTPLTPSQRKRAEQRKATRLDRLGDQYDSESYRHAIIYALQKAAKAGERIPHWFPYQLRHAAVTATAMTHGREIASLHAGHTSIATTDVYDHRFEKVERNLAEEREDGWWLCPGG